MPHGDRIKFLCANCQKEVILRPAKYTTRLNKSKSGMLFCSHRCSKLKLGKIPGAGRKPKRKPGMTDEQFKWEMVLHDADLGEHRGLWLLSYGHEDEVPEHQQHRAAARKGK